MENIIDAIKGLIERGELKTSLVDRATIETVVNQLTKDETDFGQVCLFDCVCVCVCTQCAMLYLRSIFTLTQTHTHTHQDPSELAGVREVVLKQWDFVVLGFFSCVPFLLVSFFLVLKWSRITGNLLC